MMSLGLRRDDGFLSVQQDSQGCYWVTYNTNHYTTIDDDQAYDHQLPTDYWELSRFVLTGSRMNLAVIYQGIYSLEDGVFTYLCHTAWMDRAFSVNGISYFNPSGGGIYIHDGTQLSNLEIDVPGYTYNTASRLTVGLDGRMWFLCDDDLVCYADSSFVVYPLAPAITGINSLSTAPDGNLWMGDDDGVIWIFNGINFREFITLPGDEMIREIVFGSKSEVWILTSNSLFVWHEDHGLQVVIPAITNEDRIRGVSLTPEGKLIVTINYGYFIFQYVFPVAGEDTNLLPQPQILQAYPNPATGEVKISAEDGRNLDRITIYNLKGQMVRKLGRGALLSWDTTDNYGKAVPNGIYFIKAERDGKPQIRKIVIRK